MNRKYQSYKQTGVEWIGEIPSHWNFIKTNILTENLDGKRVPLNSEERGEMEGEYPYWGSNGIVDYVNQFIFNEEIVLVGEDGSPFFDKLKDVSFYVNEPVWVNNHIHILKPKERILPRYLTHSFNCVDYKEYITGSTRDKLTQSDLKRISHCVPPLHEQEQIVQFLDEKTELIDRLVSTKERKITLLKEQRTSLINEVVTKGLNPNVKMKDSGVEWIGEIPEHWELKQLKYLIKNLNSGVSVNSENVPIEEENELGVLKTSCVYGDVFRPEENKKVVIEEVGRVNCPVIKDSIIISRMNTPELVGSSGYVHQNYSNLFLPDRLWITEFKEKVDVSVKFYSYILKSDRYKKTLSSRSTGTSSSMKNISKNDLLSLPVPYFDIKEQHEITTYLDDFSLKNEDLIQFEQKKIDLLKEYRQSLISEVVTGKINVIQ